MPGTPRPHRPSRSRWLAVVIVLTGTATLSSSSAEAARGRRGTGYGVAGGVTPELGLANVFSGIYGLGYTFDRAHYDFNACVPWPRGPREGRTGPYCRRPGE